MGHLITLATLTLQIQLVESMGSRLPGIFFTCARRVVLIELFNKGNMERILESIAVAKSRGATVRVGPELEISRYVLHSWEVLAKILASKETAGIVCDLGMPIEHKNTIYNCHVVIHDQKVLLIRPKMWMAKDGNYRELQYFTPWTKHRQTKVPFGDAVISTADTCIGVELCEELFTPASPYILMGLDGVEIFTNSSLLDLQCSSLLTSLFNSVVSTSTQINKDATPSMAESWLKARSRTQGYFIPLSGGMDSCATAVIVYSMFRLVADAARRADKQVIADARRIAGEPKDSGYIPSDPREFSGKIFHTCYMGTENSSAETRPRGKDLADIDLNMDTVVTPVRNLFGFVTGVRLEFRAHGGSNAENLALQNIQARLRMVLAYLFVQLLPWVRGRVDGLLVLGSANVDESPNALYNIVSSALLACTLTVVQSDVLATRLIGIWGSGRMGISNDNFMQRFGYVFPLENKGG
ncbi:carbon-nitrogen hydrolase [Lentinula aciculospora]|uniref:NAD(+) synthase [glutamine-hydrolyzing] n=1 Tax=Lentinula aciculospora TaxID=153920 RepID=A0A9W9DNL2_9AGAR|nr:carbon-nitrogen hydrolase [Lentinula aciculospora]